MKLNDQTKKIEELIDSVYNGCLNHLGESHPVTKQSLKTLVYFQGLKIDVEKIPDGNKTNP